MNSICELCSEWLIEWLEATSVNQEKRHGPEYPLEIDSLSLLELLEVTSSPFSNTEKIDFSTFDQIVKYLHGMNWCKRN